VRKSFDRQFFIASFEGDDTGRFVKYDPATKQTTVLINNLRVSNGLAVSKDGTFIAICDTRNGRYDGKKKKKNLPHFLQG
jgi:sugar lactone lactonase YvrE